jgi:hypothetical protein
MGTASTIPATATTAGSVTSPKENGFETFLSKAASGIEKALNIGINIATAEQPLINQLLPPQFANAENAATALIKNVMLTTEAKYQAIGKAVPYGQKVAEVVAITGAALIQILAGIGVTAGQGELLALVTGATSFSALQTSGLTTLAPATTTAP